jgi:hypothetical protein
MKKVFVFSCMIIALSLFLAGLAYSQSLEEIRAQVRTEVRSELGLDESRAPEKQEKRASRTKLDIIKESALILMVLALIPATIAKLKGRSFIAWWVLGLLCFIVVFPVSVYLKKWPKPAPQE